MHMVVFSPILRIYILNDDFVMMNIFQPIAAKVPPFQDFLTYIFEKNQVTPSGAGKKPTRFSHAMKSA